MSLPGLSNPAAAFAAIAGSSGSVLITNATVSGSGKGVTSVAYRAAADGWIYTAINGAYMKREEWRKSGLASDFSVFATNDTGTCVGPLGSEQSLSADQTWSVTAYSKDSIPVDCTLTVQIRNSTTHAVLSTASIGLSAERIV